MPTPTTKLLDSNEWHAHELLLMREVMRLAGHGLSPQRLLSKMQHLMSELLGLNRGRVALMDPAPTGEGAPHTGSTQYAYGLTPSEAQGGRYAWGEGVTGRVLATGLPAIVQEIDAEPLFCSAPLRSHGCRQRPWPSSACRSS